MVSLMEKIISGCCLCDYNLFYALGGGITERNLERILRGSGAMEFHCSARTSFPSLMSYKNTNTSMGASLSPPEFVKKVSTYEKVKNFVFVARSVLAWPLDDFWSAA